MFESPATGATQPVYLVAGEAVLAEPAARRFAESLAEKAECEVETHRRPNRLGPILDDLRTYSLFQSAKIVLVLESAVLADRRAAAGLIDDAAPALPVSGAGGDLSPRERQAASRLLQALRLFDIDPDAGEAASAVGGLPDWALQGGSVFRRRRKGRGRGKRQVEELSAGLAELLECSREAGLVGKAEGDLAELGEVIRDGLPEGHALVLGESAAPSDHPLVSLLAERGAAARVGELVSGRGGGWQGLELLTRELETQTGVGITRDAVDELARRTLKASRDRGSKGVDAETSGRFAAEYRKLASRVGEGRIDRGAVVEAVEDRGEEDVWKLLDAIGIGRDAEAQERLHRLLAASADPIETRLSFFALLADFCRQLSAVRGLISLTSTPTGVGSYPRFKTRHAPALQGELAGGVANPVAKLHPYRLHRVYLAASRLPEAEAARLPGWVLDTELKLKGESDRPEVALSQLVSRLSSILS